MQQQQFIDIIKHPQRIESAQLANLEVLVNEYPFFETAHLLYIKGLHKHQAINYSKQLRKTAIVVNSRSVLYELLHQPETASVDTLSNEVANPVEVPEIPIEPLEIVDIPKKISPISVTDSDIKVIYVNTVSSTHVTNITNVGIEPVAKEISNDEINIIKSIENETEPPVEEFNEEKLNNTIEQEINKSIIQSYVETDIIKTPELNKHEISAPNSFTDWLTAIKKEAPTFQIETKTRIQDVEENTDIEGKSIENDVKSSFFAKNKHIIDKIIESDPGRIKLGTGKFFTPAIDAKQSLLENEHLVTETLAKIYALQGNISKAIRSYEILSLKFPQKSVYFASLIEKLKTNK